MYLRGNYILKVYYIYVYIYIYIIQLASSLTDSIYCLLHSLLAENKGQYMSLKTYYASCSSTEWYNKSYGMRNESVDTSLCPCFLPGKSVRHLEAFHRESFLVLPRISSRRTALVQTSALHSTQPDERQCASCQHAKYFFFLHLKARKRRIITHTFHMAITE